LESTSYIFFVTIAERFRRRKKPTLLPLLWFVCMPSFFLVLSASRWMVRTLFRSGAEWRRMRRYRLERDGV
jgi:hypothetical protein